ncbi:MAG: DUF3999 family protein [Planctomycetota bacterium]|nr:DUF3999 family protein [Planctomycetota bacterium]
MSKRSIACRGSEFPSWVTSAAVLLSAAALYAQENTSRESLIHWQHVVAIEQPAENTAPWVDSIVGPEIFDGARYDLSDLRVYTGAGQEVPYALRVRSSRSERQPLDAREFNRTKAPGETSELTLDLGEGKPEHNALEVDLPGHNYRRRIEVEGSDDGDAWRPLRDLLLVDFRRGSKVVHDDMIEYPLSRFRYLRIKLHRDLIVDGEAAPIGDVKILRTVEIPGEKLTLDAAIGKREAVRADAGPGSSWDLELGGDQTPVSSIEVQIADAEFVRNFNLEAGGPPNSGRPFTSVARGVFRRRAGEPLEPMRVEFSETRAARLRLIVTDNRNPPLQVERVRFAADARQVVCTTPQGADSYKLYFGNSEAEDPSYDFARNLPQNLEPEPDRATLGGREANPIFEPEPLPFTERWPWAVYLVLGLACLVLAAIATSLSRAAIALHDTMTEAAASRRSSL